MATGQGSTQARQRSKKSHWRSAETRQGGCTIIMAPVARNLAAVARHFRSEAVNEVEKALETFTDDIVWEAPAPNGLNRVYRGKAATAENYRRLFSMRDAVIAHAPGRRSAAPDPSSRSCATVLVRRPW
jgi:hypothetical protein